MIDGRRTWSVVVFIASILLTGCSAGREPQIRRLSFGNETAGPPEWSSDGEWIAFIAERKGQEGVYLANAQGEELKLTIDERGLIYMDIEWSPDGQKIAVTTLGHGEHIQLLDVEETIKRPTIPWDGESLPGYDPNLWRMWPEWSPEGTQIVYKTYTTGEMNGHIEVVDLVNRKTVALTDGTTSESGPRWSPSGMEIAFSSWEEGGNANIFVVDLESGRLQQLTSSDAHENVASWSPNGQQIIYYTREDDEDSNIFVVDVDSGKSRQLTFGEADDYHPTWSPDGRQIAFVSERDGNPEIYVMSATGRRLIRLTYNEAKDTFPDWSPDGKQIAFISERDGNPEIYVVDVP